MSVTVGAFGTLPVQARRGFDASNSACVSRRSTCRPATSGVRCGLVTSQIALPYHGPTRILDLNGSLLDVGMAEFGVDDDEGGTWEGTIRVLANSCLASKSITSLLELSDGTRVRAQVGPTVAPASNGAVLVKAVAV